MKRFSLFLLGALFFLFGCKKDEVINVQQLNSKETAAELASSPLLMTSSNPVTEKFKQASLQLTPTSYTHEYTASVSFEYEGTSSILATIKLSTAGSSIEPTAVVYIQPGSNLIHFYSFNASSNGTISAKIQLGNSGIFYPLASVEAYFPVYDPILKLQGLPEYVSYVINRTLPSSGAGNTEISVHFYWDEKYRTIDKTYTFTFFLNYGSGIYLSESANPSQGGVLLSTSIPGIFDNTFFNYKVAVIENEDYYYLASYFNRPSSTLTYGPSSEYLQTKVLRKMGDGLY